MLCKNLLVYRLPIDWSMTAGDLETRLVGHPLRPCRPFEMQQTSELLGAQSKVC
jgi:DNA recombination-dependent growth factor C